MLITLQQLQQPQETSAAKTAIPTTTTATTFIMKLRIKVYE